MARTEREMPFLEHLEELRRRLIVSLLSILVLSIAGYFFSEQMLAFLTRPLDEVYFMGVTEAFAVKIKVALLFGLFAALPVIFYQMWMFVAPGLYPRESRLVVPVVSAMFVFFLGGAAFCFFVVLPIGIEFLLGFGGEELKPMIMIGKYISFVGWMTVAFGAVFELPVVTFVLGRVGVVDAKMLRHGRRYAIVGILIVAAIATPSPDVFSQLLLAGPLYLLYEISIALVAVSGKKRGIEGAQAVSNGD
jgi:sec-independent protein translocase protein TatC